MKKLLALLLILCTASTANAVLTWSTSVVTIAVGSTVTVQIISDDVLPYAGGPAWVGNSPSEYAHIVSITPLAAAGGNPQVQNPSQTGWPGWWTISAPDFETPFTIATGPQWEVVISGDGLGFTSFHADYYGNAGADDILWTPEPTSIVFLGLGSLMLFKRKRFIRRG